jgi:hypothetical protein
VSPLAAVFWRLRRRGSPLVGATQFSLPLEIIKRRNAMPFKATFTTMGTHVHASISIVVAGSNKLGHGISCQRDWLGDAKTINGLLDFIRQNKTDEDPADETQILLDLFPEQASAIKATIQALAKQAILGHTPPSEKVRHHLPPFDDGEEDETDGQ